VPDRLLREQIATRGAFVGRAVVGHDALDLDAVAGEPIDRPRVKDTALSLRSSGEQLAVGEPGGVVEGDMDILPAEASSGGASIALAGAIAGDAVAGPLDATELLDVDVQQLARALALVADDGRRGSRAVSRPRPRRRSTTPTVETGRPRGAARWRVRSCGCDAVPRCRPPPARSAATGCGGGARSGLPDRPRPRRHAGHAICAPCGGRCPAPRDARHGPAISQRLTISIRLWSVVRAFW
jgi:hypothetical protein